jgi:hypothetical protein
MPWFMQSLVAVAVDRGDGLRLLKTATVVAVAVVVNSDT